MMNLDSYILEHTYITRFTNPFIPRVTIQMYTVLQKKRNYLILN